MSALGAVVDAGGVEVSRLLARVEQRMGDIAVSHGALLGRYAGDTIAAGGKRLRPLLLCLAAGVPPPESEDLVRAASAVELVHAATLVHDDVLDGASLRRGRPTVVAAGGRRLATSTGDLLFSRAFAELASAEGSDAVEAVRILSRASSELALGELLQRADTWNVEVTEERYRERCRLKTAVLFRAACELGALLADGDGASLARFAERIGLAFQILDDVLDVAGSPSQTGKPRGTDLLDGTVTLPLILGRIADPVLARIDLRALSGPADIESVCDLIAASGALEQARAEALGLVAQAKAELPGLPERQRIALELVADGVVERYS